MAEISFDYIKKCQETEYTMPVLANIANDDWAYCLRNLTYVPYESDGAWPNDAWFVDALKQCVGKVYRESDGKPVNVKTGIAEVLWCFKSGLIIPSVENQVSRDVSATGRNNYDLFLFHATGSGPNGLEGYWAPLKYFAHDFFAIQKVPFGFEHMLAYMSNVEANVFHRRPVIVKHGVKFANCAFHLNQAGDVVRVDNDPRPYLMTLDIDYDDKAADEAVHQLGIVTADAHSHDNLVRWFAAPLLSQSREDVYLWYGRGGEGKGAVLSAFEDSYAFVPYFGRFTTMFRGGGKATADFNVDEIASDLWAADGQTPSLTESMLTGLETLPNDYHLSARRIGRNIRTARTNVIMTVAANRVPRNANRRHLVVVTWDNHGKTGRGSTGERFYRWIHEPSSLESCMMASCRFWEKDGWRGPWRDIVTTNTAMHRNELAAWVARVCLENAGHGTWQGAPGEPTAAQKKAVRDLLGLKTATVRVGGGTVRGYKIIDQAKFDAYVAGHETVESCISNP